MNRYGILFFSLFFISTQISAVSYSDYFWDDFKAALDWGRVSPKAQNRFQNFVEEPQEGFGADYHIYGGGAFRSQRGGDDKDQAGKYLGLGQASAQAAFYYRSKSYYLSLILGPRLLAAESKLIDKTVNSVWDGEAVLSLGAEFQNLDFHLEGGRGWQRLDGFGFLFNGMAEFGEVGVSKNKVLSFSLLSLRMKPEEESLSPKAWNHSRREMWGGNIRSQGILFWENLQFFHYIYREPNFDPSEFKLYPQNVFGHYLYSGMEFRSASFWKDTNLDLTLIRVTGSRKQTAYPWQESEQTTDSFLAYSSLHGNLGDWLLSISGLYTRKDKEERRDSNSDGYAAPLAEPRVLGGYSSFLLYQSVYFPNDRLFYDLLAKKDPGFENKGIQMTGIQIGHSFLPSLRGDVFLNRSHSEMGMGTEMILKLTGNLENTIKGFFTASICYANVDPQKTVVFVTEPFREKSAEKEFWRYYVSAGFKF